MSSTASSSKETAGSAMAKSSTFRRSFSFRWLFFLIRGRVIFLLRRLASWLFFLNIIAKVRRKLVNLNTVGSPLFGGTVYSITSLHKAFKLQMVEWQSNCNACLNGFGECTNTIGFLSASAAKYESCASETCKSRRCGDGSLLLQVPQTKRWAW